MQSCNLSTIKWEKRNFNASLVIDLIKVSWYLNHVEQMVRNVNSIGVDVIEDTPENVERHSFHLFSVNVADVFDFLTMLDKFPAQREDLISTNGQVDITTSKVVWFSQIRWLCPH